MINIEGFIKKQITRIGSYVAENIASCYLLVKKYRNYSSVQSYYLGFVMATYVYIQEGIITPSDLKAIAVDCSEKPEIDALVYASAYIGSIEVCSENNMLSAITYMRTEMNKSRGIKKAVKGVLKKRCKNPVYKAIDTEKFRSILEEAEAEYLDTIEE